MSVCCSVGYYGSCANSPKDTYRQYNLACPNVCDNGQLNFWQDRCLERIGNPDIKCCYKGCKEAAKHPELKAKMDRIIAECNAKKEESKETEERYQREYNHARYKKNIENNKKKPRLAKSKRAEIISFYINGFTIAESVVKTGCNKSIISMYRRLYREKAMDREGNILI